MSAAVYGVIIPQSECSCSTCDYNVWEDGREGEFGTATLRQGRAPRQMRCWYPRPKKSLVGILGATINLSNLGIDLPNTLPPALSMSATPIG